ncbi:DUF971 domain-containing protein [bacterium]|nr:DUF971 domain-containing protein [bacterium]
MSDATEPEAVDLRDSQRKLVVTWGDGKKTAIGYRDLRLACRCANCVDEVTGVARLDARTVPDDIGIRTAEQVGLYGIRFDWTDGHATGIYTWARLRARGAE